MLPAVINGPRASSSSPVFAGPSAVSTAIKLSLGTPRARCSLRPQPLRRSTPPADRLRSARRTSIAIAVCAGSDQGRGQWSEHLTRRREPQQPSVYVSTLRATGLDERQKRPPPRLTRLRCIGTTPAP